MSTLLDELERDLWKRGANWRPDHYEDYKAVLALVTVARITIKRRRNALERARTTGEEWDRLEVEDLRLMEQESAALAPLLAESGEGDGHADTAG